METASHVPAWKKLGLKLKYAKEEDYSTYTNGVTGTGTGTGDLDEGVNGVGNKNEQVNGKGKKRRFEDGEEDDSKHSTKKNKKEKSEKKREKKRVSFSADTKERDGDADGDESDREDGGVSVSGPDSPSNGENNENESNTNDTATQSTEKKDKKKKKSKKDKDTASSSSTHIHETPILSYLSQYHTNRATWKFHKNRETQLFKHILSLEHVPSRYNAALLAYLRGLKSDGAKERLFQTAEGVVKGDIEGRSGDGKDGTTTEMEKGNEDENGKPDTKSYDNAVEAFRTWLLDPKDNDSTKLSEGLDDDTRKHLETRQRAELVIFAVQDKLFSLEKPKPTPQTKDNGKVKKVPASKKKKKNRTAIVEISSSSESDSESESSSDSDSDSDSSSSGSSSS